MTMSKGTRYALYAAAELALAGKHDRVTVGSVSERHDLPHAVLAKVFQRLAHAGIAVGERGSRGGYHLTRRPEEISLLEIVRAFEPGDVPPVSRGARRGPLEATLGKIDARARRIYASVSLRQLVGARAGRGGRPRARNGPRA